MDSNEKTNKKNEGRFTRSVNDLTSAQQFSSSKAEDDGRREENSNLNSDDLDDIELKQPSSSKTKVPRKKLTKVHGRGAAQSSSSSSTAATDQSRPGSSSMKKRFPAKIKSNNHLTSTELCKESGTEWLSDVDSFKEKDIDRLSVNKKDSFDFFQFGTSSSSSNSNSSDNNNSSGFRTSNNLQPSSSAGPSEGRPYNSSSSDSEDEVTNVAPQQKKRRLRLSDPDNDAKYSLLDSSTDDESDDSEPFVKNTYTREEELWLRHDIEDLNKDKWNALSEIKKRQLGFNSHVWCAKARASRTLVKRFRIDWELKKHTGCVNALHFNQSGSRLASGSDDLNVMLWDWVDKSKGPLTTYQSGHRNNVFQAKFIPNRDDRTLVTTARDGQVRLANLSESGDCETTKKVAQHHGSAHKLALQNQSDSVFLSCGEDGTVFHVDIRLERPSRKLVSVRTSYGKVPLYSISAHPQNEFEFAVSGRDPKAYIFDQRKVKNVGLGTFLTRTSPVKEYCPHQLLESKTANITCCVYNWDGSELLCSYNDDDIFLFQTRHTSDADYTRRFKGHRNRATVKGVNFYGPYSEYIISGSDCGNMFLWDKESSRILNYYEGDNGGVVNVLEPHPEHPYIATSGLDSEIKIWSPVLDPAFKMCPDKLRNLMLSNKKEREHDVENMPDSFQNHLLWFLMQSLRNRAREVASDSSDDDDDTTSPSDNEYGGDYENMRCIQS